MVKILTAKEAVSLIKDGDTIAVSSFLTVGTPFRLIHALAETGVKNLHIITNDSGYPDKGTGRLIANRQVAEITCSYVGANPESQRQMESEELKVNLIPQGTLIERLRSGGAGLGGILTPTGVGTLVEDGKQKMVIDGKEYLLELPLKPKFGFVKAHMADKKGNLVYRKAARNFNPIVAMAGDITIAETDHIVEIGEIDPDYVMTPFVFVDILVSPEG